MMRYIKLVVKFPWMFVLIPLVLATVILALIIVLSELPSFNDPRKGFETRRTLISNQLLAYDHLKNTFGFKDYFNTDLSNADRKLDAGADDEDEDGAAEESSEDFENEEVAGDDRPSSEEREDSFFCGKPDDGYSKLVYESKHGRSLLNVDDLQSMCRFEEDLTSRYKDAFKKYCDKTLTVGEDSETLCCRSWSLANYVAMFAGKSSCRDVVERDVDLVKKMIATCLNASTDYDSQNDVSECKSDDCLECSKHAPALEDMLFHITDSSFSKNLYAWHLKNSRTLLPLSRGSSSKELFYRMEGGALSHGDVLVVAMDFGLKEEIFDHLLVRDTYLCVCGVVCIMCLLFCYTKSLLVTLGTLLQIFTSLVFTFSAYQYVLRVSFFPFLNMLAVAILIATGVDNTFVIHHIWCQMKFQSQRGASLHDALQRTVSHAFKSLFVTSATTSAALFSGIISDVIVLKCFAIFSGISLVFHFLVAMLMMPAILVLNAKCSLSGRCFDNKFQFLCSKIDDTCADVFQTLVHQLVVRLKWAWICIFSVAGLVSFFVVSVSPKLQLPSSNNLQLFISDHPFEVYESVYRDQFAFDKPGYYSMHKMPMKFAWGLSPDPDVPVLDPDKNGRTIPDETFDPTTPAAQTFLFDFCRKVRKTEYFEPKPGFRLSSCFVEKFKSMMGRSCKDLHRNDLKPCCSSSTFPYSKRIFKKCLRHFLPKLARDSLLEPEFQNSGLRFNANYTKITALVVEFTSNQSYRPSYAEMQKFYNSMKGFTDVYLQYNAPPEMKNGWFLSDLGFYDLQHSLVVGTPISLFLSIAVAATFAFATTRNIVITGLAMVSISTSIMVTVAVLVFDGWELGVFESMSISLAVGLSIDYALHYGIAYQHSQGDSRQAKVVQTIRMSSAVALAAATTFFVGLFLVPSVVLAYRQLAIFLMTVTSVSWLCSTLFYLSLLLLIGPRGAFGEVRCCQCPSANLCKPVVAKTSESNSPNLSSTGTMTTTNPSSESKPNEATELVDV